ncbi:hypothetical protein VC74_gp65 [Mycobacterium phage Sparky]|uniref:Uncharacterized protein n=2 Tax=Caudoviricetes TaxID=2731619 RepID=A0A076GDU7_9CAUD|nr:hypothetical protein VC74_gp65 [Mycobacterium phage Sparky]AII28205.1 hypothetical protein PBI_SPARKY_61 [Mycobacterium phage Sparky]
MNNPLAEDDSEDEPHGEYPDLPARSGVTAVLRAADAITAADEHARNLQAAVSDIRIWCSRKHTVGAIEILNILKSHHV